jgi:hypothetical protein
MIKHKVMNNIKKTGLTLMLVMLSLVTAKSQKLTAGLYGAFSTGSVKITDIPSAAVNTIESKSVNGAELGLYAKLKISKLYIKPMSLLNYRTGTVQINSSDNLTSSDRFSFSKFEVPLLVGWHLGGPFNVEAGPVYNYLLSFTDNLNGTELSLEKSGIGYRAGVTAEVSRLTISVSYQGLRTTSSSENISTFRNPYELLFGLGLRFGDDESNKKEK